MTGKIDKFSSGNASGSIKAENGLNVHFDSSAVLAYDATRLAEGQLVTFELESGSRLTAANVCVHHPVSHTGEKHHGNIRFRYMGFEHKENIRAYRFDRISVGEQIKTFIVTADLALFAKHHVGIQDGPTLCLHLLMAELDTADATERAPSECSLTDRDMLAHLACRPTPGAKAHSKFKPRAFAAASHVS
jgi:cold shock CspA family protein